MLNAHYFAEIRLKIGLYRVEIFQNRERNYQHFGKIHRRASHAILMNRSGFSTFRRGCVASQRVAGPIVIGQTP